MIGEQVRPLEAIVYTYGRCCQPDASIIDMTPSPADKNLVEKGEISQEEHDLAERQYKASKAVAELVCNDCVVRPQCRQYCLYAKQLDCPVTHRLKLAQKIWNKNNF